MKLIEINRAVLAGRSVVTGTIQRYKAEQTEKFGCNEKFGVLVGDQVLEFAMWAPKGTTIDKLVRPAFADKPGTVVAVLDATIKLDGKYLRTSGSAVVSVEP